VPDDELKIAVSLEQLRGGISLKAGVRTVLIVQDLGTAPTTTTQQPGPSPSTTQPLATTTLQPQPATTTTLQPQPATTTLQPQAPASLLITLEDPHFEFDKTFPLPSVIPICRDIGRQVKATPPQHILVVGHADKVGKSGYNKTLSRLRAANIAGMLHDTDQDVESWLSNYRAPPAGRPWGTREDQHMLSALPHCGPKLLQGPVGDVASADSKQALQQMQRLHGLPEDGKANDATRRVLIRDYLNATAIDVPGDIPLDVLGAGFFHRIGPTDADDRRVDIFLFDEPVTPPPSDCEGAPSVPPGVHHCDAYDAWKKEVTGPVPHDPDDGCGGHAAGGFVLTAATAMTCQHGGQVQGVAASGRQQVAGSPVLRQNDAFTIAGCTNNPPCASVTWITAAQRVLGVGVRVLLASSIGQTRDAAQNVTGIVQVIAPQPRVQGS
jgi:outer membrane protein OmpA-like peptidoglycan-associated protein